jgi:hypothetical protein
LSACLQSNGQELALVVTLKKKVMLPSSKPACSISEMETGKPSGLFKAALLLLEMLPPAGRFPEEKRRLIDGKKMGQFICYKTGQFYLLLTCPFIR